MASGGEKKRRKLWKDEDMVAALESVNKKEMTVAQAATTYNVPRKTLDDRVKGCVLFMERIQEETLSLTPQKRRPYVTTLSIWQKGGFL